MMEPTASDQNAEMVEAAANIIADNDTGTDASRQVPKVPKTHSGLLVWLGAVLTGLGISAMSFLVALFFLNRLTLMAARTLDAKTEFSKLAIEVGCGLGLLVAAFMVVSVFRAPAGKRIAAFVMAGTKIMLWVASLAAQSSKAVLVKQMFVAAAAGSLVIDVTGALIAGLSAGAWAARRTRELATSNARTWILASVGLLIFLGPAYIVAGVGGSWRTSSNAVKSPASPARVKLSAELNKILESIDRQTRSKTLRETPLKARVVDSWQDLFRPEWVAKPSSPRRVSKANGPIDGFFRRAEVFAASQLEADRDDCFRFLDEARSDAIGMLLRKGTPPADAMDATSQALLNVCIASSRPPAREKERLRMYFFRAVTNASKSEHRNAERRSACLLEKGCPISARPPTPEDTVGWAEEVRLVDEALCRLPHQQQTAILLASEGRSVRDIAKQLKVSKSSAQREIDAAKDQIRNKVMFCRKQRAGKTLIMQ